MTIQIFTKSYKQISISLQSFFFSGEHIKASTPSHWLVWLVRFPEHIQLIEGQLA